MSDDYNKRAKKAVVAPTLLLIVCIVLSVLAKMS